MADSPADHPLRGRAAEAIPILMYHVIGDGPNSLYVSVTDFRAQMEYLERSGYQAVTMQQVYEALAKGAPLPRRAVAITFDDGYESHYSAAFAILKQHHFLGTFYVITSFIGRQGYLSAGQILEMDRAGMEIDAHTRTHVDLTTLSPDRLTAEVAGSKDDLERLLGHEVSGFCYPAGRFTDAVVKAVAAAGYRDATTTELGLTAPGADVLRLPRVRVFRGESLQAFVRSLEPNG